MKRFYHVVAIPIRIVLNHFGDYNDDGMMYVLKENEDKVKEQVKKNPFTPVDLVQPLCIRANVGDTVHILFENKIHYATGMHFQEADYNVLDSDGANVGFNPNTLAKPGEKIRYEIEVHHEGVCFFSDLGNPDSSDDGTNINGLFGCIFVQKRGSWWTDPETGGPINSGQFADIHHPFSPSFREYAFIFHDEMPTRDITGNRPLDPVTNQERESTHAINYRYEPVQNRVRLIEEGVVCPECDGEEVHHDSWVFGDPATPIFRGYRGDPAKFRLVHGGVKETHVFHYHVHTWFRDPQNTDSAVFDSQAISPQTWYTVEPLYGLGSLQGAIGDAIIHCHLYPHFGVGMWAINRVFDTLQDGSQCYPNGVPIKALQPLPDRPCPPKPTKERPGFPNFIPGKVGCKAPRPPLGIVGGRGLTELERNAAVPTARPGAVFVEPCLNEVNPVVEEFHVSLIELPVVYNREGWNDPKARIYVLDEDLEDVLSGKKEPEPLILHFNAGSCISLHFTNRLPEIAGGDAFQLVTRTYETSFHVHFVKFDVLVSDGANVGWNYDSSVLPGETIRYEYFADVELKAWFFHDHLFANYHQQHGVFGSGVVHGRFSRTLDSKTGEEVRTGTEVTVTHPLIPDYRDFVLMVQDFTLLFDKDGCPLQPPEFPGSQDDPGLFGVNYKNEPLQFRLGKDCDPAYTFSSFVNGDPITNVFKCYEGDPIRIRLLQGAHEESHSFNLHGLRWKNERPDVETAFTSQEHIGISESFTFEMDVPNSGDYLWTFETEEDLWNGLWGLIRAFDQEVDFLIPLPDRPNPPKRTKPLPVCTGKPPEKPQIVNVDAPANAPIKKFDIVAFHIPIIYSKWGEVDPFGIVFSLREDMDDIVNGKKKPTPLILRANQGDVVEIKLTSFLEFDEFPFPDGIWPYPPVKEQAFYPPSVRISLHPQLIQYDVKSSAGETVGFNPDQTVGPGETITYKWYVDLPLGACGLWDMADIRNHRSLGTFGAFIAETRGTQILHPKTLKSVQKEDSVIIKQPFLPTTREFVLIMFDGARLEDKQGCVIIDPVDGILGGVDPEELEDLVDTYDNGSRGFNYRTERLINRLRKHPVLKDLFSSKVHGDPSTPVFEAYPKDPVTFRLINPSERRRAHTFHLHGHYWKTDDKDINSQIKSIDDHIVLGHAKDLNLFYGAGSFLGLPGDYMYRSGNIRWDIEQGMWGIMRVHKVKQKHLPRLNQIKDKE
ncbi:multicopper oxidase domain-containing protein [Metabacillus malikii]|uniref:FtsP/CotA-like multicopper oxidase with cupredoxin domain n=1 Tax=Metabacillus malikii TaxID=1504265 RepID=A0ABT9ZDV2_9BACI|nr:multicopper oxidase domain-containing protein [Metabacillus malikii]MDQ0230439.1 FtsP/CotA-like multicopper oxidase with cupredoxin domain [Metabacillus malikii]